MNRFLTIITLGIIATSGIIAATFEPYNRSRLFWDISSRVLTISNGVYGRVYELQNGRMVSVAATSSGYTMSFSDNKGKTWNDQKALFKARGNRHVANPEVFQMSDGTVLIGYNERPNAPYGADHPFLITLRRSTDNCETWSEPITIYTGDYVWENGCWEPIFLELPSGELQCYFSDETPFKTTSEQYIVMSRSFDGGFTWTKPIITSYRAGCRDGMPVPVITEAGEIVYTIEDFGHPGYSGFRATTIRTTLEDNWTSGYVDGNSSRREIAFENPKVNATSRSHGPYVCHIPETGEYAMGWMGDYGDREGLNLDLDYYDMYVAVGDKDVRNFKAITAPFDMPMNEHATWISVAHISDGTIAAVGQTINGIEMIKGRPMKSFSANYGTPAINGDFHDDWTEKFGRQVKMGSTKRGTKYFDYLYDSQNLYFIATVFDKTIISDKTDNDGVYLSLDLGNLCSDYPIDGIYRFFFDLNGTVTLRTGSSIAGTNAGKWVKSDITSQIKSVVTLKSSYYIIEAAIPWSMLGCDTPPVNRTMRTDISIANRTDSELTYTSIVDSEEALPAGKANSHTWMEFTLNENTTGVSTPTADGTAKVSAWYDGSQVNVSTDGELISLIELFAPNGSLVASETPMSPQCTLTAGNYRGIAILRITTADNSNVTRKIVIK